MARREELLTSPHLSKSAKKFHAEVFWKLDHNALFFCKIIFKLSKHTKLFLLLGEKKFQVGDYHWGMYEGSCDAEGKTVGIGRWVRTTVKNDQWDHLTYEGCFSNDKNHGLGGFQAIH